MKPLPSLRSRLASSYIYLERKNLFFNKLVVGQLEVNCYVLANSNQAVVIDAGDNAKEIIELLKSNSLVLEAIINTHGHYDHIGANSDLAKEYNCPVYIHKDEIQVLKESVESLAFWSGGSMDIDYDVKTVADKELLKLAGLEFKVIHTPGHSPGGICLLQDGNLFTGDTLFKQSIGRTDFPYSNPKDMKKSLQLLKQLDKSLKIFPGHGPSSVLYEEF